MQLPGRRAEGPGGIEALGRNAAKVLADLWGWSRVRWGRDGGERGAEAGCVDPSGSQSELEQRRVLASVLTRSLWFLGGTQCWEVGRGVGNPFMETQAAGRNTGLEWGQWWGESRTPLGSVSFLRSSGTKGLEV